MAQEVRAFAVTIPAGTAKGAGFGSSLAMPPRSVQQIEVRVPPGPRGEVGFQIGTGGNQVLPLNAGQFIVTDDEVITWDLEEQLDSGAWQLLGYNTGTYDHTIGVRFLLNPTQSSQAAAAGAPIASQQLGSGPAPAPGPIPGLPPLPPLPPLPSLPPLPTPPPLPGATAGAPQQGGTHFLEDTMTTQEQYLAPNEWAEFPGGFLGQFTVAGVQLTRHCYVTAYTDQRDGPASCIVNFGALQGPSWFFSQDLTAVPDKYDGGVEVTGASGAMLVAALNKGPQRVKVVVVYQDL